MQSFGSPILTKPNFSGTPWHSTFLSMTSLHDLCLPPDTTLNRGYPTGKGGVIQLHCKSPAPVFRTRPDILGLHEQMAVRFRAFRLRSEEAANSMSSRPTCNLPVLRHDYNTMRAARWRFRWPLIFQLLEIDHRIIRLSGAVNHLHLQVQCVVLPESIDIGKLCEPDELDVEGPRWC